jgi:histidinol-phosphatase
MPSQNVGDLSIATGVADAQASKLAILVDPGKLATNDAGGQDRAMSETDELLGFAMELADAADRVSLKHFGNDPQVATKPDHSFVTEADTEVERQLRERIESLYPSHGILGEELGRATGDGENRWIIDPIDSTHNFMRGVPVFATLIAFERSGQVLLGIISAPAMNQRWHALRGRGAWSGARRLRVSTISNLSQAQLFYASRSTFVGAGREAGFDAVVKGVWRERGFGDFWGYALVAQGSGEAMLEPEAKPWDLAAPLVVVEEAGGRLTDLSGRPGYDRGSALASNGVLHEEILERLNSRP